MDAGRRAFNPQSWGLYYSRSVYLSIIYVFTSFIARTVGWYGLKRVTRTTLSRVWDPRAMARVAGRETPSGSIRVSSSAR